MVEEKDFFISYNAADRSWAEWIAWQLEVEGYTTILQARDFHPSSNFILEMDHAMTVAKRTIAVLSADYLEALYTKPEWAEALRQDPTGKDGKLVPVRVRACTLKGLLASIVFIDLIDLNPLAAQNALLTGLRRYSVVSITAPIFPGDPLSLSASPPVFPGNWPLVWNIPYRRNPFFTGREKLIKVLHEQLAGSKNVALTQTLAIHGLGGIGKTQTAVEYAYRYQQEYQAVFWVRAATRDTLISDYVTVANLLHLAEKSEQDQTRIVETLKYWFSRQKDWLLILDNADDLEILPDFLPGGEKGHLLLTTRDPAVEGMAQSIEVEQMDIQEGIDLLLLRAHGLASTAPLEPTSQEDRVLAEQIVKEMGGLPLALDQAGAYIEQMRCGLAHYLEIYHQRRADLLRWKRRVPSDYPKTVATTWALAFEQVEQHSPAAVNLLQLCAFLHPDSIPEDLFTLGASELGPALQLVVKDPFAFNETIDVLRSFALIRRLADTKSLAIHRLMQLVLKDRLDNPMQLQWAEQTVRLVNAAFPAVTFETWEQCKRYLSQVFTCMDLMALHDIQTVEASSLLHRAGWYLNDQTRYQEAESLYLRALAIDEKTLGPEHPDTSATLDNLALLYRDQGRYQEAEPLFERALAIREKALGPEHPDTSATLNNLSGLYRNQGHYQKAEPLYLRALAIDEKTWGAEHPDTGATLNNLALLYRDQGRYQGAEPLFERALVIREKTLGSEHPDTSATLNNLAGLYRAQGRYQEAVSFCQRALVISEKTLGPENPHTTAILNNLALLYRDQGRYQGAEPLIERALAIGEKILGPEHSDTSATFDNLAGLYQDQGRYREAEPLYQRTLITREKTLGPEHPDTSATLNNLAELYRNQGRYPEAEPLYLRSLVIKEKMLGPEHPSTSVTLNNLASLYRNQERYPEAESLYLRSLILKEKMLGPEHPEIGITLNNLAGLYRTQGRYQKAELLYQRVLAIYTKTLEPEHPEIGTTLNNLALLYRVQERYQEAEPLYLRSLAISEKTLGPEHPDTGTILNNLALLYQAQRRYQEAEPLYQRALTIYKKTLGPEHPRTVTVLENYATLLRQTKRREEAGQLQARAQIIRAKQQH